MVLWSFPGCYTFSGTTLPGHLKTIQINPAINQTLDPALAERLTQAVIRGFENRSSLRAVNENGHCELKLVLSTYSHTPYNTSGSDVTDYRIDLSVAVQFYDHIKDKILFEEKSLPGFATYSIVKAQTELDGQKLAIDNIVELILDNTISGW